MLSIYVTRKVLILKDNYVSVYQYIQLLFPSKWHLCVVDVIVFRWQFSNSRQSLTMFTKHSRKSERNCRNIVKETFSDLLQSQFTWISVQPILVYQQEIIFATRNNAIKRTCLHVYQVVPPYLDHFLDTAGPQWIMWAKSAHK